jgi:hypothetical protein
MALLPIGMQLVREEGEQMFVITEAESQAPNIIRC